MSARDEAIKAAMEQHWWRFDKTEQVRPLIAGVLDAAVPALLNDLADRIEDERIGDEIDDWNVALIKAAETVRAATEGWRAD